MKKREREERLHIKKEVNERASGVAQYWIADTRDILEGDIRGKKMMYFACQHIYV